MRIINFFGGPGAGKSTAASGLYYEMKKHWMSSEYVQEYAKELVWSDSAHMLSEQNYIFAEQEHRLNRLRDKVAVAVADSPLLLSSFYAPKTYPDSFHQSVFDFFHTYENINIFVRRSHEYSLQGRIQNKEEADAISNEMERYLRNNGIAYWSITASDASPRRLLTWLIREFGVTPPQGVEWVPEDMPADWIQAHLAPRPWRTTDSIMRSNLDGIVTVGA